MKIHKVMMVSLLCGMSPLMADYSYHADQIGAGQAKMAIFLSIGESGIINSANQLSTLERSLSKTGTVSSADQKKLDNARTQLRALMTQFINKLIAPALVQYQHDSTNWIKCYKLKFLQDTLTGIQKAQQSSILGQAQNLMSYKSFAL